MPTPSEGNEPCSDVELTIDLSDWPSATEGGVRSLFLSVLQVLSNVFNSTVPVPINLAWRANIPNTKSYQDRTDILLSAHGNRWNQFVYQAAHEITHALIRDFSWLTLRRRHKWFEEAVCELASYYVLLRFANTWEHVPVVGLSDFESTRSYAPNHREYCLQQIRRLVPEMPTDLGKWFRVKEEPLTGDQYNRPLNAVVSVSLLPVFSRNPRLWRDCAHLNQWDTTQDDTFEDYLKSWFRYMRSIDVFPQGAPLEVAELLGLDIGVRRIDQISNENSLLLPDSSS